MRYVYANAPAEALAAAAHTPVQNPSACYFALWPWATNKPTIQHGSNNDSVGYLMGVLKCKSGQTQIYIHANPGPWYFNLTVKQALMNFQSFWGLTVDGMCGPQTWPMIDWAAQGFPT